MATGPGSIGTFDARNVSVQLALGARFPGTNGSTLVQVQGFADGDYLTITPRQSRANIIEGCDGRSMSLRSGSRGVNITINLMAHTQAHRLLNSMTTSIRDNIFAISIASPDTNESGYSRRATIVNQAQWAIGETAGFREWEVYAADWRTGGVDFAQSTT